SCTPPASTRRQPTAGPASGWSRRSRVPTARADRLASSGVTTVDGHALVHLHARGSHVNWTLERSVGFPRTADQRGARPAQMTVTPLRRRARTVGCDAGASVSTAVTWFHGTTVWGE